MQLMTFLLVSGAVAATVIWLVDAYEKQAEMLKKHNDEKVEFFSIFSHEINTPLTAINGFAQFGERISTDGNFSEKDITQIQTSFARIYRASEHLKRMSRQLLEVTMIDQGIIRVNLAPCDFSDIIEQVQTQFEAGEHGNELVITKTENLPLFCADPDKFIQVFLNLIQNADKHTENGKIFIWAVSEGDNLLIHVKDTGTGIQEELIPHLFKKYPQTIIGGIKTDHGLGLYICKVYVNAMRGEISLVKTSKEGTEFMISLPTI
jgi:signal transduction histidine kinase